MGSGGGGGGPPAFPQLRKTYGRHAGKTDSIRAGRSLYLWDFDAGQHFGEVDYNTDALQLSCWVDSWLGQTFPTTAGAQLLTYTAMRNWRRCR